MLTVVMITKKIQEWFSYLSCDYLFELSWSDAGTKEEQTLQKIRLTHVHRALC